jgi:hypothetical protein
MYTLNLERSAVSILEQVGVLDTSRCANGGAGVMWVLPVILHTYVSYTVAIVVWCLLRGS